jgi:hypothetical protein
MAKLFQITAVRKDQLLYNPSSTLYLNTKRVISAGSVIYNAANGATALGTNIRYAGYDGTYQSDIIVSEAIATINTRMNAANTTDVHSIALTTLDPGAPSAGYTAAQQTLRNVNVDDIWLVGVHPINSANSVVMVQNTTADLMTTYRATQTAASIATAANS